MVVWVVSLIHGEIKVIIFNLKTGYRSYRLQRVNMNVLTKIKKIVVCVVSLLHVYLL